MEYRTRVFLTLTVAVLFMWSQTSSRVLVRGRNRRQEEEQLSMVEAATESTPESIAAVSVTATEPTAPADREGMSGISVTVPSTTEEQCENAFTNWSPWTGKWENIKGSDCGRRRRTRRIKVPELEEKCRNIKFPLSEFQEFCEVNSRAETTEIFQFYFVDEIFGHSTQQAVSERRRKRETRPKKKSRFSWKHIFSNHKETIISRCPDDVSRRPVDFLVMLDKSGSMTKRQFRQLIKSINFLVQKAIPTISSDSTRMAMITFANQPTIEFDFNTCFDKTCVQKELRRANFTGGITRMAHALEEAEVVFNENRGMRRCSRRVVLLITDGSGSHEHINPEVPATNLKVSKGVEIFVVGVTDLINEEQLQSIASSPVLTHLFFMPSVKVVRRVCKSLKPAQAHD